MRRGVNSEVTYYDDDGYEITCTPPGRWEVCDRCRGSGAHCNPAIDGNGLTSADIEDLGGHEFLEEYHRGTYDVICEECGGERVVWEIDWDLWHKQQPNHAQGYEDHLRAEADYRRECEYERRMGA
jgi:hypothetical protein